jgi:hypothetical protein
MTATTKRLIIVLLITLGMAGGVLTVVLQLQSRATDLTEALQTIANQAAVEREFAALSEVLERTSEQRAQIANYYVVGQAGSITFLDQVERLASAGGVELTNPRLTTGESEALATPVIKLTYNFSGPQAAVDRFITQLEQLPVASYLDSLSYTIQLQPGGIPEAEGTVTIHAVTTETDV